MRLPGNHRQGVRVHVVEMLMRANDHVLLYLFRCDLARHHSLETKSPFHHLRKIGIHIHNSVLARLKNKTSLREPINGKAPFLYVSFSDPLRKLVHPCPSSSAIPCGES